MKRLCIVVPFRLRHAHLMEFVPHMRADFARDKVDRETPYRVLIVEQENGQPFNRGALKNIGFQLGRDDSDYTCFHDVDYLPIWADYSWVDLPSSIVWYGAEATLLAPGRSQEVIINSLETFFGAAVLVPNALFAQVNGYSNDYWGWGYEDTDLRRRFQAAGISMGRRKGTFTSLPHDNEGMLLGGKLTAAAAANLELFRLKWMDEGIASQPEGLSNLAFEILSRRPVPEGPTIERNAIWEIVTVRPNNRPRQTQIDAAHG